MKVYDIISEAQPQYNPGALARRQAMRTQPSAAPTVATTSAPMTTGQKAASRSAKTTANIQRVGKLKGKGAVGDARVAYAQIVQKLKGRAAVKDIYDTAKNAKSALATAKLETFMKNIGSPAAALIRYISLYDIITDYFNVVGVVEEAYQNGDLSEDSAENDAIFKSYISQLNGILTAKLAVWYAGKKTSFTIAKWVARFIRLIVGGGTTLATAGIGLAAVVASEGFFIWLERFLDSDQGRDWLLNTWFGPWIIGLGKVQGSVWDSLTGYYKDQAGAKDDVQNKKALATATTPQAKQAAQATIDAKKAAQARSDDIDALQKELK
jgi:hypothetical protein